MEAVLMPGSVVFLFGIVAAKWAMDLGYSQISQILHFLVALFLGPLVLLVLYIRLVHQKKALGQPGAQIA
jgi:hypothetical protein